MKNPFASVAGGVLSADIAVPQHDRELDFYAAVLTTGDAPLWQNDLMNSLGAPVIGLGVRTAEYADLPIQWMPHFQVADVADSVNRAISLGGEELLHGKDENGRSLWAGIADPQGAAFGLIPIVEEDSYQVDQIQNYRNSGHINWLSLAVPDATTSRDFYQQVLGWTSKPIPTNKDSELVAGFEMMIDEQNSAAEICQFSEGHHVVPAVWLLHLPVGDLLESLRQATMNGGEIVFQSASDTHAIIRDPAGVYLVLQAASAAPHKPVAAVVFGR